MRDLILVLMTAGSGGVVFWLIDTIPFLMQLPADLKRYVSLFLSCLVPVLAWLVGILMAYWTAPDTWRAWVEAVFAVASGGIITSQTLHAALRLRTALTADEQAALLTDAYERGASRCGCGQDKQP